MKRILFKIIINALAIVGVILGIWFLRGEKSSSNSSDAEIDQKYPILEAVKHVNKHILIEHYSMVDVRYSQAPISWMPFIKQETVILLRGRIPAGFDLEELTEDDIWISRDGKRVQLTLPPPKIFEENVAIDFENSRILSVSDRCPDFICENSLEQYQSKILPTGRDMLIAFALQTGILEDCAEDGRQYYQQLLKSLGFEEVRVIVTGYGL